VCCWCPRGMEDEFKMVLLESFYPPQWDFLCTTCINPAPFWELPPLLSSKQQQHSVLKDHIALKQRRLLHAILSDLFIAQEASACKMSLLVLTYLSLSPFSSRGAGRALSCFKWLPSLSSGSRFELELRILFSFDTEAQVKFQAPSGKNTF
jgi:hypothetical protein